MRDLIPMLQTAIGPVIFISGVGLLLLSMTNRFGRIIDRSRMLAHELKQGTEAEREIARGQVGILWRRAILIRRAIALAATSVLLAAILMIVLFLAALDRFEAGALVAILFSACLITLIASLVSFIQEINESLSALRLALFGETDGGVKDSQRRDRK
jgi:uncharacterized protein DUF2721